MKFKENFLKIDQGVFVFSLTVGILFIILDAFIGTYVYREGTLVHQLINPSPFEIYFRGMIFFTYVVFGFIVSKIVMKVKLSEENFKILNSELNQKNKNLMEQTRLANLATEELEKEMSKTKEEIRKKENYFQHIEQLNKFMVDRELKMIELKKEINTLLKELDRQPQYNVKVESI